MFSDFRRLIDSLLAPDLLPPPNESRTERVGIGRHPSGSASRSGFSSFVNSADSAGDRENVFTRSNHGDREITAARRSRVSAFLTFRPPF
jgi:hypothetical protein